MSERSLKRPPFGAAPERTWRILTDWGDAAIPPENSGFFRFGFPRA